MDLHSSLGPAASTITAIADRAGVDRLTVYRHFPDQPSIYRACLECWTSLYPLPDPTRWQSLKDPRIRLRSALSELYAHYRANEGLWANGLRDLPRLPELAEVDRPVFEQFARMRTALAAGWGLRGARRRLLLAALGHALSFSTWQSLVREQGLEDEEGVDVLVKILVCLLSE